MCGLWMGIKVLCPVFFYILMRCILLIHLGIRNSFWRAANTSRCVKSTNFTFSYSPMTCVPMTQFGWADNTLNSRAHNLMGSKINLRTSIPQFYWQFYPHYTHIFCVIPHYKPELRISTQVILSLMRPLRHVLNLHTWGSWDTCWSYMRPLSHVLRLHEAFGTPSAAVPDPW